MRLPSPVRDRSPRTGPPLAEERSEVAVQARGLEDGLHQRPNHRLSLLHLEGPGPGPLRCRPLLLRPLLLRLRLRAVHPIRRVRQLERRHLGCRALRRLVLQRRRRLLAAALHPVPSLSDIVDLPSEHLEPQLVSGARGRRRLVAVGRVVDVDLDHSLLAVFQRQPHTIHPIQTIHALVHDVLARLKAPAIDPVLVHEDELEQVAFRRRDDVGAELGRDHLGVGLPNEDIVLPGGRGEGPWRRLPVAVRAQACRRLMLCEASGGRLLAFGGRACG
mmetsp:Transcript_17052/g.49441  ORF Transcript_17052/g.49441 Transcript_17052/m.49441 type:complete len:275 (-) Transcript_17052:105-929(-)